MAGATARIYCAACRHDYLLVFSCKTGMTCMEALMPWAHGCAGTAFCPSCHQKRLLLYGDWVDETILAPVPHRQYVFTLPKLLRHHFRHRPFLGEFCRIVARFSGGAMPGLKSSRAPRRDRGRGRRVVRTPKTQPRMRTTGVMSKGNSYRMP